MFLIGCLIYVILCVYAWIFADRILFPAPKGPSYEKDENVFFLETKRGDQIACKHWIPENPKGLTILYSHGNAEDIGRIENFLQTWVKMVTMFLPTITQDMVTVPASLLRKVATLQSIQYTST